MKSTKQTKIYKEKKENKEEKKTKKKNKRVGSTFYWVGEWWMFSEFNSYEAFFKVCVVQPSPRCDAKES